MFMEYVEAVSERAGPKTAPLHQPPFFSIPLMWPEARASLHLQLSNGERC